VREQRLLEREHEGRGFARGRAALGAGRGDLGQQVAHFVPRTVLDVLQFAAAGGVRERGQELLAVLAQLLARDHVRAHVIASSWAIHSAPISAWCSWMIWLMRTA
jgi:hypothetical protein